ncbi:hypothetical protein ACWDBD_36670 [Streptomyces sp. NPDC001118]
MTTDMTPLLNSPESFADFIVKRRKSHGTDHDVYDALYAAIRAKYRTEHIDGDGKFSARRRSRRMERQAKKLVKGAKMQYEALEALQVAQADHIALVAALPGQRQAKALAKAQRNAALSELATKSLHKTAQALTSKDADDEANGEAAEEEKIPASLFELRGKKKRGAA